MQTIKNSSNHLQSVVLERERSYLRNGFFQGSPGVSRAAIVLFATILYASAARQATADNSDQADPLVLVLLVGNTEAHRDQEEKFTIQLKLSLAEFEVRPVSLAEAEFVGQPLATRLETIKSLTSGRDVIATVWLDQTLMKLTLLNLVSLSTGHAMVKIVEAEKGPEMVQELALAAYELLAKAYLLETHPRPPAVDRVVADVVTQAKLEDKTDDEESLAWSLSMYGALLGGLGYSDRGQWMFGGGASACLGLLKGFTVHLGVLVLASLQYTGDWGTLNRASVAPELGVVYRWRWGRFGLGPKLSGQLMWTRSQIGVTTAGFRTYQTLSPRLTLGLSLQIALTKHLGLLIEPGFGYMSRQEVYIAGAEDSRLYQVANWSFYQGLGLEMKL